MKRMWIYIFLAIALIILYLLLPFEKWGVDLRNAFLNTNAPAEYSQYVDLNTDDTVHFGGQYIYRAFQNPEEDEHEIYHFITKDNNLIVQTVRTGDYRFTDEEREELKESFYSPSDWVDFIYTKLTPNGEAVSTYIYQRSLYSYGSEFIFGEYIINPVSNYYNTWIIDDDTAQKSFKPENQDLTWSASRQEVRFKELIEKTDYFYIDQSEYHFNNEAIKQKVFYFLDGQWCVLFMNIKQHTEDYSYRKGAENYKNTVFKNFEPGTGFFPKNQPQPNVTLEYFQRKEMILKPYSRAPEYPFSTAKYKNWRGDLYARLFCKGDTLKFVIPIIISDFKEQLFHAKGEEIAPLKDLLEKRPQGGAYFYFEDPWINFSFFSTDFKNLYLIKSNPS